MATDISSKPVPDSSYDVARRNLEDLDKIINQTSGTVTTRAGNTVTPIKPLVDSIVANAGWNQVGTFASGFTFTNANDVGQDASGNWWRWNGALPKVVTAGTLPTSNVNYKLVGDGVLRQELATPDSTVPVGGEQASKIAKRVAGIVTPEEFGATGDGFTDDTTAVFNWFAHLAANPRKLGLAADAVYAVDTISLAATNGLSIIGNATFKAIGSSRLNMIALIDVQGDIKIDGLVFDGSNIVARPFEIQNIGNVTSGNVYIRSQCRFINAKNIAPAVFNASGCRVQGNFNHVVFEGEVDGVDNTLTSGGVSVGFWSDWSGTSFIKNTVITSKARIKNVKNDNATTSDADGIQCMGPTNQRLNFTVEAGAYFENCKGRSIKSQVTNNAINSPVIVRNAYDGLVEVDCQYAGGYCIGARIYHDGVRVENVISSASRFNLPSDFTMRDNVLTIINAPVSNTGSMCFFWGVDNTDAITQDGLLCSGNKVIGGAVNHLVTVYVANVVNTNRAIVKDNYAEAIGVAFVDMQLVFNNPAQLTLVFEGNSCKSNCTGINVVSSGRLTVESDRNNSKISALPANIVTINAGVLTLVAGNMQLVATEGGAGFDDVDTISGGNYATGDTVLFRAWLGSQRPQFVNGSGNIRLAGSNFELNNVRDSLLLTYDAATNEWYEVSRADNGA